MELLGKAVKVGCDISEGMAQICGLMPMQNCIWAVVAASLICLILGAVGGYMFASRGQK